MNEDLHVLIVDDDEVDRMAIRRTLCKLKFHVEITETTTANAAVEAVKKGNYTWILMDYRLPDMDGLALIKKLRKAMVTIPIIVLTGQGDEQVAVEVMKAGASDYLSKARVSPEILSRMLHNSLRIFQAEQRAAEAHEELGRSNALLLAQNQELEQQREKIAQQNLQLIEAYRLKSEFLATMSHELRTPLNAILGFSQILQSKDTLDDYQHKMVRRIFANGEHLLNLVNDILDFSNIESRKLNLQPTHFNLEYLIFTLIEKLKPSAKKKNLELQFQMNLDNPMVWNDRQRLYQVLLNLISNAIKFTEAGTVRVSVMALGADQIEIQVTDTGIGIAAEQLPYIFDAFRQVDQSIRRNYPGTGLGLAITDALIRMMGGTISVESQLNVGSVFRVNFPRRIAEDGVPEDEKIEMPHSFPEAYSTHVY
ncbi:hybrid sensor histidine kinase/response regulator [Leptolyngbya sp. FACHB-16]|uniref:ATP-binding response regulator n=1 Tax=unclassified Leptolyngbya TaxID=2650499 RepID=UPI0016860D8B|nr:hybrid sensor histidine kinase/response regulator [Leptolyngbya sp. FACHB-16]MBD2157410.1 response regulator [Leptolyngbya sp. FACHB-16]